MTKADRIKIHTRDPVGTSQFENVRFVITPSSVEVIEEDPCYLRSYIFPLDEVMRIEVVRSKA